MKQWASECTLHRFLRTNSASLHHKTFVCVCVRGDQLATFRREEDVARCKFCASRGKWKVVAGELLKFILVSLLVNEYRGSGVGVVYRSKISIGSLDQGGYAIYSWDKYAEASKSSEETEPAVYNGDVECV